MHCFPDYTIPFLKYFKFNKTDWSSRCLFIHCLMLKVEKREKVEGYLSSCFKIKSRNKTKLVQRSSAFPQKFRKNELLNES